LPIDLTNLINMYENAFKPGLSTFSKRLISINLKSDDTSSKFFRARPLPFAIADKIEKELNCLVADYRAY
ncbi:hypothetical protein ILUMI_04789, partial [Ignelater luminosus]